MPTLEGQDPPSLEERVRRLERFRYGMLGRVNALTTMLLSLWADYLHTQPADALAAAQNQRALWLEGAERPPSHAFRGADPDHLQLISQEYRDALEQLSDLLIADARRRAEEPKSNPAATTSRKPRKGRRGSA
jgi:hypothetical protein